MLKRRLSERQRGEYKRLIFTILEHGITKDGKPVLRPINLIRRLRKSLVAVNAP